MVFQMACYEQISCPDCEKIDIKKFGLTPQLEKKIPKKLNVKIST